MKMIFLCGGFTTLCITEATEAWKIICFKHAEKFKQVLNMLKRFLKKLSSSKKI